MIGCVTDNLGMAAMATDQIPGLWIEPVVSAALLTGSPAGGEVRRSQKLLNLARMFEAL
jgi:hypothetical protein